MTIQKLADAYDAADQDFECVEGLEIVKEGDWSQDGKYQQCETVVRFEDNLYLVQQSRTGSYHTDWHYGSTYFYPCERHEETKVVVSYTANGTPIEVEPRW